MGATWAGVHLRGVSSADLEAAVLRWAQEEGLMRIADGAPEDPSGSRRILLLPGEGWITLCDEDAELDEALNLAHAARLSRELRTYAVSLQCFHSDAATLTCHWSGEELGQVRVPEEVERDRDGHAYVDGSFLAPIAPAVTEGDWRVRGDFTFPEDTITRLAALARIPDAGAGARYLWADPAVIATRLLFRAPASDEQAVVEETGPTVLSLHANSPLTARTGIALSDAGVFQVSVESGAPQTGAHLILEGPALALLEIRAIEAWNGHTVDENGQQIIWRCEPERDGARLRFHFADARLRKAPQAMVSGSGAAAMRRFSQALQEGSRGTLMFRLDGQGAKAGAGELTMTCVSGDVRASAQPRVEVRDLPPRPVLPPRPAQHDPEAISSRWVESLEAYSGDGFSFGWIAFDGPFAKMEDALTRLLEGALAKLTAATGKRNATVRIVAAGAHPELRARWSSKKRLADPAWAPLWDHLRREAIVTFQAGDAYSENVSLAHQPNGNTVFTPEMREHLGEMRPGPMLPPVSLSWSIRRPDSPDERASVAAWMDACVREAASMESCIAAVVSASKHPVDASRATPYEEMSGLYRSADSRDWLVAHARMPGWRVVVPRAAASKLPAPDDRSRQERVAAGILVSSNADDPFAFVRDASAREAMERLLLPCIGTADEQIARSS